jgi:hypothetical protein
MRHALLFILLFTLVSLVLGAETVSTGNGPNAVNLLSSTMQETILEFRVISFESSSVSLQDKQWQLLSLPREGILLTEGHPQLPVLNRSLAIPGQGKRSWRYWKPNIRISGWMWLHPKATCRAALILPRFPIASRMSISGMNFIPGRSPLVRSLHP